jgi:hypothetical protein
MIRKPMRDRSLMVAAILLGALARPACAQVVFNSLVPAPDGADPVLSLGPIASSFSSGPGGSLTQVDLLLQSPASDSGFVTVDLLANDGTSEGSTEGPFITQLGTVSDSAVGPSGSLASFDIPSGTIDLTPSTRYWVAIATTTNSDISWDWTLDFSGTGVATEFAQNAGGVGSDTGGPYEMLVALNGASAPEPGSLALAAGCVLPLVGVARRRRGLPD